MKRSVLENIFDGLSSALVYVLAAFAWLGSIYALAAFNYDQAATIWPLLLACGLLAVSVPVGVLYSMFGGAKHKRSASVF